MNKERHVRDPDTRKMIWVAMSDDEIDRYYELLAHDERDCEHETVELRARTISNGAIQHVDQCITCGKAAGMPVKREPGLTPPPWDTEIAESLRRDRQSLAEDMIRDAIERQREELGAHTRRYDMYLKSEEWAKKRRAVLERDGGICRGCLSRPATQVHHLTYENIYNEFAFELVSICDQCHERVHADRRGPDG